MKVILGTFVALALTGCVSSGVGRPATTPATEAERAGVGMGGSISLRSSVAHPADRDERHMAKVEAAARNRGVAVIWINPPRVGDR